MRRWRRRHERATSTPTIETNKARITVICAYVSVSPKMHRTTAELTGKDVYCAMGCDAVSASEGNGRRRERDGRTRETGGKLLARGFPVALGVEEERVVEEETGREDWVEVAI